MGGKKAIGENRNRGHLHHRFTGRGGYPITRGIHGMDSSILDSPSIPIMQEFSLFAQFDVTEKFRDNARTKDSDLNEPTPFSLPGFAHMSEQVEKIEQTMELSPKDEFETEQLYERIMMLENHVQHLTTALQFFESNFYHSMNNLYYMGFQPMNYHNGHGPSNQPQSYPPVNYEQQQMPQQPFVYPVNEVDNTLKKLSERVSTLEGRQSVTQSKLAHLDTIYGPTAGAWSRSIKQMYDTVYQAPPKRERNNNKNSETKIEQDGSEENGGEEMKNPNTTNQDAAHEQLSTNVANELNVNDTEGSIPTIPTHSANIDKDIKT